MPKQWSMPDWMIPYCTDGYLIYPKDQIEDHMNRQNITVDNNSVLALMIMGTKSRVDVLTKLHNNGQLK